MANIDNLIPTKNRTPEEAREMARKGGYASGVARRAKKSMKQSMELMLNMALKTGKQVNLEDIETFGGIKGKNITVQDQMIYKLMLKALKGDKKAFELIRDTSGQKPVQARDTEQMQEAIDKFTQSFENIEIIAANTFELSNGDDK
jgi:general stress protein YciG